MGIFNSLNNPDNEDEDINGYKNTITFEQVNAESVMEELDIFTEMIDLDFMENEAVLHEEYGLIPASVFINLFEKVRNFIKKILDKIKRIFDNIIVYFSGSLINKNKEFVKKYGDKLRKKILNNLKGLKLDYYDKLYDGSFRNGKNPLYKELYYTPEQSEIFRSLSESEYNKNKREIEDFDATEYFEHLVNKCLKTSYSKDSLQKEMEEDILGDKETYDEDDELKKIVQQSLNYLESRADFDLKEFKKAKSSAEKCFNKLLKELERATKMTEKLAGSSTDASNFLGKIEVHEHRPRRDVHRRVAGRSNNTLWRNSFRRDPLIASVYTDKDKTGNASKQSLTYLTYYRTWLTLFTKKINVAKDMIVSVISCRSKIVQKICLIMRSVCVKTYMFKLKHEDAIYEDFSDDVVLNYINFIDDYHTDIIL